jgi:hypothetical protein
VKTRTAVLLLAIGATIAASSVVVAKWPSLPRRTLPEPVPHVAMAGQPVEVPKPGCLAPVVAELRKRPSWVIRLDDRQWTDYTQGDDNPHHASIVLEESGASWKSAYLGTQTLPLDPADVRDVLAAFELSCERDESLPSSGDSSRYVEVAYGKIEKAAAQLPSSAPITVRLGEVFERLRARYVANRVGATKTFVLKLSGLRHTGPRVGEWSKHSITMTAEGWSDADLVDLVDWALAQPQSLPKGRMTATGTLTLEGVTRPIAVSLERSAPANRILYRWEMHFGELTEWISINRP